MKRQSKKVFSKNVGFLFDAREKVLSSFKSNIFPLKRPTPEPIIPDSTVIDTPKPTKTKLKNLNKNYLH